MDSQECLQDWTLHRKKGEQGVLKVAFKEGGVEGLMSTAGSDGVVRVYVKEK